MRLDSINFSWGLIEATRFILILLFTYTALDKLLNYELTQTQMNQQLLPIFIKPYLATGVPLAELACIALLLFKKTKWIGLIASATLLLSFTIYVAYVYIGDFEFIPCSCAGIFRNISWVHHLYINITLTIMTAIAAYLYKYSLARNTG